LNSERISRGMFSRFAVYHRLRGLF